MRFTVIPVFFFGSRFKAAVSNDCITKNKSGNKTSVIVSNSFYPQILPRLTFVRHKLLSLLFMKSVIFGSKAVSKQNKFEGEDYLTSPLVHTKKNLVYPKYLIISVTNVFSC